MSISTYNDPVISFGMPVGRGTWLSLLTSYGLVYIYIYIYIWQKTVWVRLNQ